MGFLTGIYEANSYPRETTEGLETKKRQDKYYSVGAGLRYYMRKWLSLTLHAEHITRDSNFGVGYAYCKGGILKKVNFYLPMRLDNKIKENWAKTFDYDLGWEEDLVTNLGYRGTDKDTESAVISFFGDSYTYGYPEIESSWPYLLEKKLKKPVLNFGVRGYGTDQAYLKFEKKYVGSIKAPYVCLVVMPENIARIMNVTGIGGFTSGERILI